MQSDHDKSEILKAADADEVVAAVNFGELVERGRVSGTSDRVVVIE